MIRFFLITLSLLQAQVLPTNFAITPTVALESRLELLDPHLKAYPDYRAGQAVAIRLSPDKRTLAILTSGYNRLRKSDGSIDKDASNEYLFLYRITNHQHQLLQVIQIPNTFYGLAWHPNKAQLYVSGGVDDRILMYEAKKDHYSLSKTAKLGHASGLGVDIRPMAAELAIDPSGKFLAVANMENDSVTLLNANTLQIISELDLRPGKNDNKKKGIAGGEFPYATAFSNEKLYVSSMRDNEVVVLTYTTSLALKKRIKVGSQPTRLLADSTHNELFVLNSRSDDVSVIDTLHDKVRGRFSTLAPASLLPETRFKGANPNGLRLIKDKLYVTNGGTNSVAVIDIHRNAGKTQGTTVGLIPTGWYPNDVEVVGQKLYIVNGKSVSGPNPGNCRDNLRTDSNAKKACQGRNLYTWQLKKAGLLSLPIPTGKALQKLTQQVAINNNFAMLKHDDKIMQFLRSKIKHVVYVVKENRTYDQLFGDIKYGDGDINLTLFPESITPNHHKIATQFVLLDNFLDSGSASNDGWVWSTSGHTTEYSEKNIAIHYAGRGLSYDNEGQNRNIPLAYDTIEKRLANDPRLPNDPDLLPGLADVAAVDGDDEESATGYLWDRALSAGLTVRNYGFYCDEERYFLKHDDPAYIVPSPSPYQDKIRQAYPNKASLLDISDPYFHGYDNNYPDLWRVNEFKRELALFNKKGELPQLLMVRLPHDHFGSFSTALAGVNTPLRQMADNDYAVGVLLESIAKSPFKDDTLVFVIEDDAQDGADHVDAHRSICLVAGPYVKRQALIHERFTTVNVLKTIESILGIDPIGLNDALSRPMSALFDTTQKHYDYTAVVPDILYSTSLSLPKKPSSTLTPMDEHNASYWSHVMKGMDFTQEDRLDSHAFNRSLWEGLRSTPYPRSKE